jgi:hypothetical protein
MLRITLAIIAFTLLFTSAACSKSAPKPSAAESALRSKAGEDQPVAGTRFLARENLTAARSNALADFIIPEVRMRLDEEPGSQDEVSVGGATQEESGEMVDTSETAAGEDSLVDSDELHNMKFSWAKKKFGDALKKDETVSGVFVLYADENYYDVGRLLGFIEEGRDKIAANSDVDPARIQVVFGGYRGLAQVEFWVVAQGERMPDPRPEERGARDPKENE